MALLELEQDMEVVAELATGDEIIPAALATRPDIAVLDIDLPGTDGITVAGALLAALPECRTLILTAFSRPGDLRRAMSAQVGGFMLKDSEPTQLVAAIHQLALGRRVIDPELALAALDTGPSPLTEREAEVLALASEGADPAEIARRLYLSAGTVRNYLTSATLKLQARNRVDAIRIARDKGWL